MVKILLEQWAKKNNIPQRTAQDWAKNEVIPAKLTDQVVTIKRVMKKYMIDQNAPSPR